MFNHIVDIVKIKPSSCPKKEAILEENRFKQQVYIGS